MAEYSNTSPLKTRATSLTTIDWHKCVIWSKTYHKRDAASSQIMLHKLCCQLQKQGRTVPSYYAIMGEDLISMEAKYHRQCYMCYTSKTNLLKIGLHEAEDLLELHWWESKFQVPYSEAFNELIEENDTVKKHQKHPLGRTQKGWSCYRCTARLIVFSLDHRWNGYTVLQMLRSCSQKMVRSAHPFSR